MGDRKRVGAVFHPGPAMLLWRDGDTRRARVRRSPNSLINKSGQEHRFHWRGVKMTRRARRSLCRGVSRAISYSSRSGHRSAQPGLASPAGLSVVYHCSAWAEWRAFHGEEYASACLRLPALFRTTAARQSKGQKATATHDKKAHCLSRMVYPLYDTQAHSFLCVVRCRRKKLRNTDKPWKQDSASTLDRKHGHDDNDHHKRGRGRRDGYTGNGRTNQGRGSWSKSGGRRDGGRGHARSLRLLHVCSREAQSRV